VKKKLTVFALGSLLLPLFITLVMALLIKYMSLSDTTLYMSIAVSIGIGIYSIFKAKFSKKWELFLIITYLPISAWGLFISVFILLGGF
tara:strand:+ start:680 stop:946 length:267 start_codon:yes stop_codon:yes gene_type:complete